MAAGIQSFGETTDPRSPIFIGWPLTGRNPTLEGADIAIATIELKRNGAQLNRTENWLSIVAGDQAIYANNWQFAPILAQIAVSSRLHLDERELLQDRLLRLRRNRVGSIYLDRIDWQSELHSFDLYPFWAWSYYAKAVEQCGWELQGVAADEGLLKVLDILVAPDGSLTRFGRSAHYREAAIHPALRICKIESNRNLALAKAIYARHWMAVLDEWCGSAWLERLTRLAVDHCKVHPYGTTYSLIWSLRGSIYRSLVTSRVRPRKAHRPIS